jgi:hypothetical protein
MHCEQNFAKYILKTVINEKGFATQKHETTFVVSKKPSKRWQDVETTSPLCVDAK